MQSPRALIAAALILVTGSFVKADTTEPLDVTVGSLIDVPGPGGCVAQVGVAAGRVNTTPADDDCAAEPGLRQVHHVTLSADERFLYAVAGIWKVPPDDDGALTIYQRSAETGELRRLPGTDGCIKRADPALGLEGCGQSKRLTAPRFVAASSDNRFLYVTGFEGIAIFRRNVETGTVEEIPGPAGCISIVMTDCTQVPGSKEVEDITFSRDGRFAYAASLENLVLTFHRNPETGTLSLLECIGEGIRECTKGRGLINARSVTLSPDERFAYVSSLEESIAIFARDRTTGALTQIPGEKGCLSSTAQPGCRQTRALQGPHRLTITQDGRFAYLAGKRGSGKSSALAIFRRAIDTGELTLLEGSAGCFTEDGNEGCVVGRVILGAHAVALDVNERTVYLSSDRGEGGIAIFRRDPETGALEQLPGQLGCISPFEWKDCRVGRRTGGLHFLAVTRDGRFAYAASENQYGIIAYRISSE
jgi:6-phosphogluconolactonase (cycloisomerase 2 family)